MCLGAINYQMYLIWSSIELHNKQNYCNLLYLIDTYYPIDEHQNVRWKIMCTYTYTHLYAHTYEVKYNFIPTSFILTGYNIHSKLLHFFSYAHGLFQLGLEVNPRKDR